MFGIKKGKEKTNEQTLENINAPVTEVESFNMEPPVQVVDTPVMREDEISSPEPKKETPVTKEFVENVIKEKKKNVLWAKILVVTIIILTIFLGLYKFADYLNRPKTLFFSVAMDTVEDFSEMMGNMQSNSVLSLFSAESTEINADIKINAEDMRGDYAKFESIINDLSYTLKVKMDRNANYTSADAKFLKDDITKMNLIYMSSNFKTYFNIPEVEENFVRFDVGGMSMQSYEPSKNTYLVEILKDELLKILDDKNFESSEASIAVNGRAIDCKKSTYVFTGAQVKTLIDNMIASLKQNSEAYYYLASLLGGTANEMEVRLNSLKTELNIQDTDEYAISAYTKKMNDDSVRLELRYETTVDGSTVVREMAYNSDNDYRFIEYTVGDTYKLYEIKGNINTSNELAIVDNDRVINITTTLKEDTTVGTLKIVDSKTKEVEMVATFSYMIQTESNTTHSVSLTVDATTYEGSLESKFGINASILVNSNVAIEKLEIDEDDALTLETMTEPEREDLMTRIEDYILTIDTEPPIAEDDPSLTPEGDIIEGTDSNMGNSEDPNQTVPDQSTEQSPIGGQVTNPVV